MMMLKASASFGRNLGRARRFASAFLLASLIAACASDPLPDYRYYKPMQSVAATALASPVIDAALEVQPLRADGLFGERPIVYSFADEPQKLSQYHYQLWTDPPGAWIQRRMIDRLTQSNLASSVTARAGVRERPAQLVGLIEDLQRIKQIDGSWRVRVVLRLRVDMSSVPLPRDLVTGRQRLLEKVYALELKVAGDAMADTISTFGNAIDQICDELVADLQLKLSAKQAGQG
jgi:cholesterol transport system auxiliary component